GSEDGPGWRPADRPWATRAILAWIAVSMVAPFLIGVALGDLGLAVSLSLGGQIPFLTLGALILLWWGLVVERVREVEIRVDGQGIAVGADRWDWKDVKAVRGGGRALIEASGARKVYSGGLVLETVEGPVAWHVTGQDGDLDALVALLESTRLRASGTSDAILSRMVGRARVLE
ncbi:MAG: hypothetical protein KC656_06775, partial [Myxococcales bacterium]|nr:hypothetical protein [Myxococcales bacterium]